METLIKHDRMDVGREAADFAEQMIRQTVENRGEAAVIFATGASQFEFLAELTSRSGIPWDRVSMFHLDEYIGLPESHPASFRRYLKERLISKVPFREYELINGEADPSQEIQRLNEVISRYTIDLACVGIGENGHLAFNDPPADFTVEDPYIVVNLDDRCKHQQMGEGWFASLAEVPDQAVSMSVQHILRSRTILCTVPGAVKAEAVRNALEGEISPDCPASILRKHADCRLVLDEESAGLLKGQASQQ